MVKDTILYDRLEISPDSTGAQIKKAYNQLSKVWHPDKHVNSSAEVREQATSKFQEIGQAKEILLDEKKRQIYDQVGMNIFKNGMDNDYDGDAQHGQNPFADFGNIFGPGFPFGMSGMPGMPGMPGMGPRQSAPEDIMEKIDVTLEQIYNEETVNFTYKQKVYCTKCDGEGSKDGKVTKCVGCDGKGMKVTIIRVGNMIQQSVGECNMCKGKGKFIEETNKCDTCNGKCYIIKEKPIQIPLKSGLSHGNKISLSGKGNQFKNAKTDLILIINEKTHELFKRLDNNLFIDIELKLYQALFGFDKIINHLDGRKLHISSSCKTDFNTIRKISGEGMKSLQTGNKGDLHIKFTVELPNFINLPGETKTQLKSILQTFDKQEVQSESQVSKTQNLTKTILTDCKPDQKEAILEAFNHIKIRNNKKSNDTGNPNRFGTNSDDEFEMGDSHSGGGQPGCAQQ